MPGTDVDSGYSWVVAVSSFFVYLMMYGVYRLSGVMFVASIPRFGVGREAASFPYTFAGFTKNVSGPVVGFLLHKFSIRTLILSGCILSAVGVATCFFAESIFTVTVLWGFVYGFGLALSCGLLPVLINDHFLKHRATAAGIAFSGMCIGSMIFPAIVEECIDFYGISGTFLIISGLLLNCIPLALFLRSRTPKNVAEIDIKAENDLKQRGTPIVTENTALLSTTSQKHKNVLYYASISERPNKNDVLNVEDALQNKQLHNKPTDFGNNTVYRQTNHCQSENTPNNAENDGKNAIECDKDRGNQTKSYTKSTNDNTPNFPAINPKPTYDAKDIYKTPNKASPATTKTAEESISSELIPSKSNSRTSKSLCRGNMALLLNSIYIIVVITKTMNNTVSLALNTVIFDYSRDLGIGPEYDKYILVFSSMGELLGRLSLGRVADTNCVSKPMFMVLCSLAQGLGALSIGLSNGFYVLGLGLFFYSFMGSVSQFMCPLIIADGIEEDKQAFAITSSSFLAGPASLTISPLIGYLRDEIGSYSYLFYGFGVLSALTGIMWIVGYFAMRPKSSYARLK